MCLGTCAILTHEINICRNTYLAHAHTHTHAIYMLAFDALLHTQTLAHTFSRTRAPQLTTNVGCSTRTRTRTPVRHPGAANVRARIYIAGGGFAVGRVVVAVVRRRRRNGCRGFTTCRRAVPLLVFTYSSVQTHLGALYLGLACVCVCVHSLISVPSKTYARVRVLAIAIACVMPRF